MRRGVVGGENHFRDLTKMVATHFRLHKKGFVDKNGVLETVVAQRF